MDIDRNQVQELITELNTSLNTHGLGVSVTDITDEGELKYTDSTGEGRTTYFDMMTASNGESVIVIHLLPMPSFIPIPDSVKDVARQLNRIRVNALLNHRLKKL